MKRTLPIVKNVLLAFVLVTIGFAAGKEATLRSIRGAAASPGAQPATPASPQAERADRVLVYYVHASIRCTTCRTIEKMTREVLESQFTDALADGRIQWREADFQEDEALARRYAIESSGVLVVTVRNGKETGVQRLDEVWTLLKDPPAFEKYVGDAIRRALAGAPAAERPS